MFFLKSYEEKIENLTAANKVLTDSLESSRQVSEIFYGLNLLKVEIFLFQSLKDKTEEIKVLERKQLSIVHF